MTLLPTHQKTISQAIWSTYCSSLPWIVEINDHQTNHNGQFHHIWLATGFIHSYEILAFTCFSRVKTTAADAHDDISAIWRKNLEACWKLPSQVLPPCHTRCPNTQTPQRPENQEYQLVMSICRESSHRKIQIKKHTLTPSASEFAEWICFCFYKWNVNLLRFCFKTLKWSFSCYSWFTFTLNK